MITRPHPRESRTQGANEFTGKAAKLRSTRWAWPGCSLSLTLLDNHLRVSTDTGAGYPRRPAVLPFEGAGPASIKRVALNAVCPSSYAKDAAHDRSDIDLLVVAPSQVPRSQRVTLNGCCEVRL